MRLKNLLIWLFLLCLLCALQPPLYAQVEYKLVWKDRFTAGEKEKVEHWLGEVSKAVGTYLGSYPFGVTYYVHTSRNAHEPVPWAHTSRDGEEAVHFYINPKFSLQAFNDDWTAAHEISHLSLPYVGRSNMWFSEGYASYMQYLIMAEQGAITPKEADKRIFTRVNRIQRQYAGNRRFLDVYAGLQDQYNFPAVYWGGAVYFYRVDALLKQELNTSLAKVVGNYLRNYRANDSNLDNLTDLIEHLDSAAGTDVFSKTYQIFLEGSAQDAIGNIGLP